MFLFLPLMIMNSLLFMMFKHPLSCGLILLLQTILTSMITGLMNYNFWYSYILFLIMIGGMLILFIYMTSIASNEKFKINYNFGIYLMISCLIMIIMMIDLYYFNYMQINNLEIFSTKFNNNYSMKKYMNFPNYFIMLIMIMYLFITLIAVVKITYFSYGPLRQKF
uniref:NADH-ubiquinone oxidoreductase chain 6 n=1 Tax=Crepidodera pluta TaxID=715800 RepID=A0A343C2H5_9CUCU|nr:NADH dehydrogenase subunit 6 [Crepidodera pluta]